MTRTEVVCLFCGGRIRWHWELIHLHATCRPPIAPAVQAIITPAGQGGSMRWCERCQAYHIGPHPVPPSRHWRRVVERTSRS
jgi:hypothetical protein